MVSGEKNDSRVKKKQKMAFAKDKKQAVLAIVIMVIFFGNGIRMIVQYFKDQALMNAPASQTADGVGAMPPEMLGEKPAAAGAEQTTGAEQTVAQDANEIYKQTMDLKKDEPQQKKPVSIDSESGVAPTGKGKQLGLGKNKVTIVVANSGRMNPFLPETESLPATLSYLTPPPETIPTDTQASEVMSTTISGILFDKYSPSAIINIGGADYLVKKGDIINGYKILSIEKTQVLVQLGKNTYKAGVGELLSQTSMNYNTIANLNKKFGGNDVAINVRKKGY